MSALICLAHNHFLKSLYAEQHLTIIFVLCSKILQVNQKLVICEKYIKYTNKMIGYHNPFSK
jgi:hypothetical protein